ncbi:oxygenase MpaB family protein [Spirillospora albida]|uniref:oxygenase MpaB family protein n=1 Tax=Spirillospora albida TaxID=58123 RepID=UPI001FDEFC5F|nr:oxygenase MpaB family protein [Spirillospora albida]
MPPSPPVRAPLGPGTLLWRHAADLRSLLPGAAAGLLQLLHPGIGAGVSEHSAFFDAPFDRIHRSVPQIWATILAPDGADRARAIRDLHRGVGGVDEHARRYHALEPGTFWWAHATFWNSPRRRPAPWRSPSTAPTPSPCYPSAARASTAPDGSSPSGRCG